MLIKHFALSTQAYNALMAGETGGDWEGPSLPGPINLISWVGPGGTRYIPKWVLFTSFGLFFSNCNSCIGGFGPFASLKDPFPRGPPRPCPPTSRIVSPALSALHKPDMDILICVTLASFVMEFMPNFDTVIQVCVCVLISHFCSFALQIYHWEENWGKKYPPAAGGWRGGSAIVELIQSMEMPVHLPVISGKCRYFCLVVLVRCR